MIGLLALSAADSMGQAATGASTASPQSGELLVNDFTVLFIILSLIVAIVFPLVMILLGIIKYKGSWKQIFSGMFGYILFTLILSTVFTTVLSGFFGQSYMEQESDFFTVSIQMIILVLCTELGRFLLLFLARKKRKEFGNAILLGAGYSVMESLAVIVIVLVPYLIIAVGPEGGSIDGIWRELRVYVKSENLISGGEWRFLIKGFITIVFGMFQVSSSVMMFVAVQRRSYWFAALPIVFGLLIQIPNRASGLGIWYWDNLAFVLPYMGVMVVISCLVAYTMWKNEYKSDGIQK